MNVRLHTSHGDIVIALETEKAPATCENFLQYVRDGFYDGTLFHRVIEGFMIQGGGMEPGMRQKATREPIQNEADNGLKNRVGAVSMARTAAPHSATAQFFINVKDNDFLDYRDPTPQGWGYCVFAQVVEGMDTVEAIKVLPTGTQGGHADVPREDVVIRQAEVLE